MKKNKIPLRNLTVLFGFLAITLFIFNFFVLLRLKPKLVNFQPLIGYENVLLTVVGFGLLLILTFYLLSLWRFIRHIRNSEQIKPLPLFLVISGVLSFLFIFSDIALLSDIHNQYRYGLSQPEWKLVMPIMIIQFITALLFLFIHITDRFKDHQGDHPARDINIFLIVQYVGVISGLMGLSLASLGFIYSTGWNTTTHSILGGITLLFPYGLAMLYWLITKFQEKERQWFDEKQKIDIGKSAISTLMINTILLMILYIVNLSNLTGIIHQLWLPIYFYSTILFFSVGNLFFSSRV